MARGEKLNHLEISLMQIFDINLYDFFVTQVYGSAKISHFCKLPVKEGFRPLSGTFALDDKWLHSIHSYQHTVWCVCVCAKYMFRFSLLKTRESSLGIERWKNLPFQTRRPPERVTQKNKAPTKATYLHTLCCTKSTILLTIQEKIETHPLQRLAREKKKV